MLDSFCRLFTKEAETQETTKNLNDDCWLHIFEYLNLEDQISAARTCLRFHALLASSWPKIYQKFSKDKHKTGSCKNFSVFIRSIHGTVESLSLKNICTEEWKTIMVYNFSNLRALLDADFCDNDVPVLSRIFPNLQTLRPDNPLLTGEHLMKFRYLENLDLDHCQYINFDHFQKILEKLPLKSLSLSSFSSGSNSWKSVLAFQKFSALTHLSLWQIGFLLPSHVLKEPIFLNLKTLRFQDISSPVELNGLFQNLVENKHNDLVEICAFDNFPAEALFTQIFPNLEKITLYYREPPDFTSMRKYAPNLRALIMRGVRGVKRDDISSWFDSHSIELISVEGCFFLEFDDFALNVSDIVRFRRNVLHLNFSRNEEITLLPNSQSPLLKITMDKQYAGDSEPHYNVLRFR